MCVTYTIYMVCVMCDVYCMHDLCDDTVCVTCVMYTMRVVF